MGVALERWQGVALNVFSAQPQVPCRCALHDDRCRLVVYILMQVFFLHDVLRTVACSCSCIAVLVFAAVGVRGRVRSSHII